MAATQVVDDDSAEVAPHSSVTAPPDDVVVTDEPSTTSEPKPAATETPSTKPPPPAGVPQLSDDDRFRRGQNLFEYGDCESVVDVLADFTIAGGRDDESQLAEAHRMLGVCFFQLGRTSEAERELKRLLFLNPDYELDPFLTPPPVVELFERQKSAMREKLDEVRAAREAARAEAVGAKTIIVERERTVVKTPWQSVLLPFGLAQAANGELLKGVIVGGVHGLLAGMNLTSWVLVQVLRPAPEGALLQVPGTVNLAADAISVQAILAQAAWVAMAVSFGAFVVAYLVGVGDAIWNYDEERITAFREVKPPPNSKSKQSDVGVAPPSAQGILTLHSLGE